jgi:dienelactone hydrolase
LRIWYPAARPAAHAARTLTPAEQRGWEQEAQAPPGTLDGVGAAATHDARPAPGSHPVLLMSPGLGETTALLSAHAADLASHGYVVVGIDVPGDTTVLEVDGELREPVIDYADAETIALRSRDMRFVLSRLTSIRGAGRLDAHRVGAFGHSNGGSTAATAMLSDHRIRAGFDLDGSIYGPVAQRGLDRPFGFMLGDETWGLELTTAEMRSHMRAPSPFLHLRGAQHHSFTDNVWLVPQLGMDPVAGDVGTIDAARAVRTQNAVLRAFFARYISG